MEHGRWYHLYGISVEHAYLTAGGYTVELTITDESGATHTARKTVEIIELGSGPPVAVIEGPESASVGEEVTFSAEGSQLGGALIVSYQWDAGDGSDVVQTEEDTFTTVYAVPGIYRAEVTVIDAVANTGSASMQINIEYSLSGTRWIMDYPIRGTEITLEFGERTISGSSGCNDYSGSYSTTDWEGGTADISMSIDNSTGRSCSQEVMHQEQGYQTLIENTSRATIDGDTLTLESPGGSVTFSRMTA